MALPGQQDALNRKKKLPKNLFNSADGSDQSKRDSDAEDRRRRRSETVTQAPAAVQAAAPAPRSFAPEKTKPPKEPVIPTIIDRHHKWHNHVVFLAKDHRIGEDNPLNPAFAYATRASSIEDAYEKAVELASKLDALGAEGRVAIIIEGGVWLLQEGFLHIRHELIDFYGLSHATIKGLVQIGPGTGKIELNGIEFWNPSTTEAVRVLPGAAVAPLRTSPIRFVNCHIHADRVALYTQRRIYAENCTIESDTDFDESLELAALQIEASQSDVWCSRFVRCDISSYTRQNAVPGHPTWNTGWVIKATAKVLPYSREYGGYLPAGGELPQNLRQMELGSEVERFSGALFDFCNINGALLDEGWVVKHRFCTIHGGRPYDGPAPDMGLEAPTGFPSDNRGGTYATIRGWVKWDSLNGYGGNIAAVVALDQCEVHSAAIARFVNDPQQIVPNVWGGDCYFRNSQTKHHYEGAAGSAFYVLNSVGRYGVVASQTGCQFWAGGGSAATPIAAPVNSNEGVDIHLMRDLLID